MSEKSGTVDLVKLAAPFPKEAIKSRPGGGNKTLSYVEGHSVINRLNAATGNCWDFTVDRLETNDGLMMAFVTLTLPGLGSRSHIGVQKFAPNSGEDLAKGAITDALKKAATLFGVGIELYGEDYEEHPEPPATDKTIARLHALGTKKGYDHAKIHTAAIQAFGVESVNDLTEAQALKLIAVLEKKPDAQASPAKGKAAPLKDVRGDGSEGEKALASLFFAAEARGVSNSDLLNMAGSEYGAESLEELTAKNAAALEKRVRADYPELAAA